MFLPPLKDSGRLSGSVTSLPLPNILTSGATANFIPFNIALLIGYSNLASIAFVISEAFAPGSTTNSSFSLKEAIVLLKCVCFRVSSMVLLFTCID